MWSPLENKAKALEKNSDTRLEMKKFFLFSRGLLACFQVQQQQEEEYEEEVEEEKEEEAECPTVCPDVSTIELDQDQL